MMMTGIDLHEGWEVRTGAFGVTCLLDITYVSHHHDVVYVKNNFSFSPVFTSLYSRRYPIEQR